MVHPTVPPFPDRSPGVPRFHLQLLGAVELRNAEGRSASAVLSQPKRVALLAYLAAATPRGYHRRDRVLALLWPELDTERARAALRKGVHWLRTELGDDAIVGRGNEELALAEVVESDVGVFEQALDAHQPDRALTLYRGELLSGFHVTGAPEFERWLDGERVRLRGRAAAAAWAVAEERLAAGDGVSAIQRGRQALALSPDDEGAVRRLIGLLGALGDRAGALHAYESLARQLADDYAAQPSIETQRLIDEVRRRVARISAPIPAVGAMAATETAAVTAAPMAPRSGHRLALRIAATLGLLVAAVGGWSWWSRPRTWITTHSRAAYADYQAGEAAYARGNYAAALAGFEQAFGADSGFAMAAFEAANSAALLNQNAVYDRYFDLARRLAERVSERERLLIRATQADRLSEPTALALAESLATRYPLEPAGPNLLGRALMNHGDFLGAVQQYRRVVGADTSALLPDTNGPCAGCEALEAMIWSYHMADSLDAAARTARVWVHRQPGSAAAWQALSAALEAIERYDEALGANRMAATLRLNAEAEALRPIDIALVKGEWRLADQLLSALEAGDSLPLRGEALWYRVISLRYQGRLTEALQAARRYRRVMTPVSGPVWAGLPEAVVLFESAQPRPAAALFDSLARIPPTPWSASRAGRNVAWNLTHEVTALAAAGDTQRLAPLLDTIEAAGARSAYGRDPLLHHYGRGLLALARGDTAAAIGALSQAMYAVTGGYSRLNLVLARLLIATRRPAEAIPLLNAPIHSALEAGNLYATQTELREALGHAYEAAGFPDSAATQYRWAAAAWSHADARFAAREQDLRRRLDRLSRH